MPDDRPMNEENLEKFMKVYSRVLPEVRKEHPDKYPWPESETPKVLEKIRASFRTNMFNHNGYAMQRTCKELGLKYTRGAMIEFFREPVGP